MKTFCERAQKFERMKFCLVSETHAGRFKERNAIEIYGIKAKFIREALRLSSDSDARLFFLYSMKSSELFVMKMSHANFPVFLVICMPRSRLEESNQ